MPFTGEKRLELFVENTQTVKKEFAFQHSLVKRMAALLYTQEGRAIDCDAVRRCHSLIKENTGIFSTFRGDMSLCIATLLSLSPDPQAEFEQTLNVYGLLKEVKLYASDYLTVAACVIAKQSEPSEFERVVFRARDFYDGMKSRHFFYTGKDDYIYSVLLGLTYPDAAAGSELIEQLYGRLKDEFWDKNSVQALAQVLVLGGSDGTVVSRVLTLRDECRAQNIKLDKVYTLPLLGILALLPVDTATIIWDISEARQSLRDRKGFGVLSVSPQELLMFAASIVAGEYAEGVKDGVLTAALTTSITNILIAQQIAMIAAISASAAASASASS